MTDGAPHEYKEKPGTCADCGNSPVNHLEQLVSNTLAVWSAESISRKRGVHYFLTRYLGTLLGGFEQTFMRILAAMPFIRFSQDIKKAATYRSHVIWEEAKKRGLHMEQLCIFGIPTEIYRVTKGDRAFYFQSLPIPQSVRTESADWLDDKYILKSVLRDHGIPVPLSVSARTENDALDALRAMETAIVIKPRSGSRGRHTSVNISTDADCKTAFASARQLCRHVSIEEYLEGTVCRGTVVNGALVGFFEGRTPTVSGDGVSSIGELVEKANECRPSRVEPITLTEEHLKFLQRRGYTAESVIPRGEAVPLTHRTGRLFGGTTRELLGSEHPKLRAYLEKAARVLDVAVVGFDLIIPEPERDPDEQRWGIIEANSLPYIDLHYLALEGRPSNIAAHVWDLWDATMHRRGVDASPERATIPA